MQEQPDIISSQELRRLMPDLAMHIDRAFMLTRLRPLNLDIQALNDEVAIRIRLTNGFTLILRPGGTMNGDYPSWTTTERVIKIYGNDPLEILARAAHNEHMTSHTDVPVYCAFAELDAESDAYQDVIPTEHKFVQSPDPVVLIDDALTWMRQQTHLPLRWATKATTA